MSKCYNLFTDKFDLRVQDRAAIKNAIRNMSCQYPWPGRTCFAQNSEDMVKLPMKLSYGVEVQGDSWSFSQCSGSLNYVQVLGERQYRDRAVSLAHCSNHQNVLFS